MSKEYQRFERYEEGDSLVFRQKEKRRVTDIDKSVRPFVVHSEPDGDGVWISVGKYGILLNGNTGNCPPAIEIQEWVEVMRECMAWYDEHFGGNS